VSEERVLLEDADDQEIRAIIISCFQELARREEVPITQVVEECLDEMKAYLASGEL
jgi:hypothetical protein